MTVYVDTQRVMYRGMLMSHMVASSLEELHAMAEQLGIRRYFQGDHYDVCDSNRRQAIARGAVVVTMVQMASLREQLRESGAAGTPEEAEAWMRERMARRYGGRQAGATEAA